MHKQEIAGVFLRSHVLHNSRCHRHRRYPSSADHGVDLTFSENAHQFAQEHARGCSHNEGKNPEHEDSYRIQSEESGCYHGRPHGEPQQDGDDVHQFILGGSCQPLHHSTFSQQIAKHEHPDERCRPGNEQTAQDNYHDREDYLGALRDRALRVGHLDLPLPLRSEQPDYRRLYYRHQSHVGVTGYDYRSEDAGICTNLLHFGSNVYSRRALSTTDDGHRRRLFEAKIKPWCHTQGKSPNQRNEYPELSRSPQEKGRRPGQQGLKVSQCPQTEEYQQWYQPVEKAVLVKIVQEATGHLSCGWVHRLAQGQISQDDPGSDWDKEERLHALGDAQENQDNPDC